MRTLILTSLTLMAAQAFAQDAPTGTTATPDPMQGIGQMMLLMGSIFAIFYFLLIRPQQKQRQKHEDRISQLKKGDKVVGGGGIFGSIIGIKDEKAVIKIADNVKIEVLKSTITHIVGEEEK